MQVGLFRALLLGHRAKAEVLYGASALGSYCMVQKVEVRWLSVMQAKSYQEVPALASGLYMQHASCR